MIIKMENVNSMTKKKGVLHKILLVAFILGIALLLINVYGLFIPMGNNDIYSEPHVLHKDDIDKKAQTLLKEVLDEKNITNKEEYFKKVVLSVNKNIAHYWWNEGRTKYNLTIPVYENYILWFKQFTDPRHHKFYEFANYKRALERRIGLCSQHAITTCGILEDKNISCKIVGLSGHVVAMAEVEPDKYWILDSDYNVIVPYSINEIEKDASIVIPYYKNNMEYSDYAIAQIEKNQGENTDVNVISLDELVNIYGKKGNSVVDGVEGYCGDKYSSEKMSFYLIWIIPLILIVPFLLLNRNH